MREMNDDGGGSREWKLEMAAKSVFLFSVCCESDNEGESALSTASNKAEKIWVGKGSIIQEKLVVLRGKKFY